MASAPVLTEGDLDALRQFDSCMVANAIETFNLRLHNTRFTNATIHCMFEDAPPVVGYAATARLRSGQPPMVGSTFHDRGDFWNSILKIPSPRILVLEDLDDLPGRGAFVGDMHAAILKVLGCIGYVTNGAVRELPAVRAMGLQLFAGSVAVSTLMPTFLTSVLPSVSAGWKFAQEIYCTVIVTEFSRYRHRLPRQFHRSLPKSKRRSSG